MKRRDFLKVSLSTGAILMAGRSSLIFGEEIKFIELPKPQINGGKPLMEVLKLRQSSREFSTEKLPIQTLSNML